MEDRIEKIINEAKFRIKDAFMCCNDIEESSCTKCPYLQSKLCTYKILEDSFNVIAFYEKRLAECENGYQGTAFLDACKLHDAEEKIEKQTKEIEYLKKTIEGARRWLNR